ncbi:WD40/YVTN/BNR-like repeat-containing protein [Actinoallomurus acaciae]|uniref:WD40/YVTN/BNR-like repeat-containing protein n=1 Tax=Actinoallomurus acaciae TaxID=502577 RepID=A0ABV5Z021_9ACTN
MRKPLISAGLAALVIAALAAPAGAAGQAGWRVTYVSPDTGYDDYGLYDVAATGPHDAWAVGSQTLDADHSGGTLLRWNGTTWSAVTVPGDTGSFGSVDGSSPNNVWVMGATNEGAQASWHWDGTSWTSVSTGTYDVADVAVVGPKNAWAVGNDYEGGTDGGKALHWNGRKWKQVAMPLTARKVGAVAAHDVWAVGDAGDQPAAEHWDGTSWTSSPIPEVPIPEGESGFAYFNDVVAESSDNVWAVGRLYWGGGEELKRVKKAGNATLAEAEHNQPVIMHWDGGEWSLRLGADGDFALSAGADGQGGIWYSSFNHTFVHVAADGTTTTVPVATTGGRQVPSIRQVAGVPGSTTMLAVGEIAPVPGGDDQSWDGVVEQYH